MEIQSQGKGGAAGPIEVSTESSGGGKSPGQVQISLPLIGGLNLTPAAKAEAELEAG